jgi:IS1 family transposase
VRRWSVSFGLGIARRIRASALARGDKWRLDEVVVTINGKKHWLWRAVDQHGAVLDVPVQSRRDKHAAKRLMRKLLKKHGRAPRVLITDKLKSYAAANRPGAERGTPAAQRTEQPRGELSPANTGAREGDASLQISASPTAIHVGPRSGGQPVHALPLQHERAREAVGAHAGLRGVGNRNRTFNA